MNRRSTIWLLAAAYVVTSTGALLALHRAASHTHECGGPVAGAVAHGHAAHATTVGHPTTPQPAGEAPQRDACALCDALAATASSGLAPVHSGFVEAHVPSGHIAHCVLLRVVTSLSFCSNPRAPPIA